MMYYFAQDKNTDEVYRCDKKKLVGDLAREKDIDREEAEKILDKSNIENPVDMNDVIVWAEHD